MSKSIRVFFSTSHDPYLNLAVENAIFQEMDPAGHILFLWRNAETVVIGKGQNPWTECNLKRMESDGVKLARRQTGGGAVFHDLGNTNFTFMSGKPEYDKQVSTSIILNSLATLGIEAHASGRNDLVIPFEDGPRKFSGSAYRETRDRGFHHGTLLLHANLMRLANYLNPDRKKLESKGIKSVRSRVCNLQDVNPDIQHDRVCQAIHAAFCEHHQVDVESELIGLEAASDIPGFRHCYDQQRDRNWNFGKSPQFTHQMDERFEWGGVEVHLNVKQAAVAEARIFTDSLYPEVFERLADALTDMPYERSDELLKRGTQVAQRFQEHSVMIDSFCNWLASEIE